MQRLLEQWAALVEYFLIFVPQNEKRLVQTEKYKRIVRYLKYVDIQAEINFVIESSELFLKFSAVFQNSEPLVHILASEMKLILKNISGRFSKPSTDHLKIIVLGDLVESKKVECGEKIKECLQSLSEKDMKDVLRKIQRHYMIAHNYLVDRLKINCLTYCECLHPEVILQDRSVELIDKLAKALSFVGVSNLDAKDEWHLLQTEVNLSDNEIVGIEY